MNFPVRFPPIPSLCFLGAALAFAQVQAGEPFLPLPQGEMEMPVQVMPQEPRFQKPTKSIKPPLAARTGAVARQFQPQVNAPTVARLRRLILMPGGLSPEAMREQLLAGNQSLKPVTVVGMDAPAPILTRLANFFGNDVNNAATQKRLLDTVSQGMGAQSATHPRRVEVVGWLPSEGVMAVAVYPES